MKKILMIATGGTIASAEGGDGLTPAMTGEELAAYEYRQYKYASISLGTDA